MQEKEEYCVDSTICKSRKKMVKPVILYIVIQ